MKILVLNCRIYSVEYEVFEMTGKSQETELCKGILGHIGFDSAILTHTAKNKTSKIVKEVLDHRKALELINATLLNPDYGVIKSKEDIDVIGHRIVHGGGTFTSAVIIDENVKKEILKDFELAPLHNPYNMKGVEAAEMYFPGKPNVAVFDTSFHHTMPAVAYIYALPERLYNEYKIRKYGFHGTSHKYMSKRVAELLKKKTATLISLHLGAGSSACAIKDGKSIDTSMGFTPLEGLVMTNRPGDVDAGVVIYLLRNGWTLNEIELCLNRESGTLGISGVSNEMKEIVEMAAKGDEKAKLAVDVFVYRIQKYLGAYYFILGGKIDAISFTGGIADNSPVLRAKIIAGLENFGIKIDGKKNENAVGREAEISKDGSSVKLFVLPRNEKILIAREAMELVNGR